MASEIVTMRVRVEREGLLLHLYQAEINRPLCTIDLKSDLELSDEQAAQMLAKFDEEDRQKVEEHTNG